MDLVTIRIKESLRRKSYYLSKTHSQLFSQQNEALEYDLHSKSGNYYVIGNTGLSLGRYNGNRNC